MSSQSNKRTAQFIFWNRYGAEAARSAGLITGTTKNIVAVYIDMRGIGRRAIVKRAGIAFFKHLL